MKLVYGKEGPLFVAVLVLSIVIWALLLIGTFGGLLIIALIVFIGYLFFHSAFISHLRGSAVCIGKEQCPDLYEQIEAACRKVGLATVPDAYLLNSNGVLNALATRFLGRNFLVLYADIVNALDDRPGAVSFYIGHELGHIRRGHVAWGPLLAPGKIFPLIGFGYRRAQEYTCDLHGLACCPSLEDAQRALVVLAAGKRRWKTLNLAAYSEQVKMTGGFWMSFHEITSDYPWLVKRLEHITAVSQNREYRRPTRNFFAWVLGLFVFRAGATGALGALIWVYFIAIFAAIAIPAYQDYIARAQVSEGIETAGKLEQPLADYYQKNSGWPSGLGSSYPTSNIGRYTDNVSLVGISGPTIGVMATMKTSGVNKFIAGKTVELWTTDGGNTWHCGPGDRDPLDMKYLPVGCREEGAP